MSKMDDNAIVMDVLPSYYWPQNAVVIVTACGHRHVRPIQPATNIGDAFLCPFCMDNEQPPPTNAVDPHAQP